MPSSLSSLVKTVVDLCRFRRVPQDLPYSPQLLAVLLVAATLFDLAVGAATGDAESAFAHSLLSSGLVLLLCWIALAIRRLNHRYVQTATALVACGLLISLVQLPIALLFQPAARHEGGRSVFAAAVPVSAELDRARHIGLADHDLRTHHAALRWKAASAWPSMLTTSWVIALPRARAHPVQRTGLSGRHLRNLSPMRIHILGICGTFMGGIAALARELGHTVEGSDTNVYPPMSTQLEQLGIALKQGFKAEHLQPATPTSSSSATRCRAGNAAIEYMLDARLRYVSGPQWLGETLLGDRRVLAVAGTHGKTTTTSLLAVDSAVAAARAGFPGRRPYRRISGVSARKGGQSHFSPEGEAYCARRRGEK